MTKTFPITTHDKFSIDKVFDDVRRPVERDIKTNKGLRPKQPTVVDDAKAFQVVFDVTGYTDKDLKITCVGDEITIDGEGLNEKGGKKSFQKSFGVPPDVKLDDTKVRISSDAFLVFMVPREEGSFVKTTTRVVKTTKIEILGKGQFYQDSYFNDVRAMFEKALKETMSKYPDTASIKGERALFDALREKTFADNKLVETTEEDKRHNKIVVDVKGYKIQHLSVNYVPTTDTLNVEGCEESKKGGKSFKKTYVLNKTYKLKDTVAGLSFEGILAIRVPKGK